MNTWFSSSVTQFTCGVVAGVGVFVLVSRGLRLFSDNSSCEFQEERDRTVNLATDAGIENEVLLDNPVLLHGGNSVTAQLGQLTAGISGSANAECERNENLGGLLFHIAKDQAYREGFIHRGITCNSCSASPICGTRFRCVNCTDYDVCEVCEPGDNHNRTHVFLKVKYPIPPLANPKTSCLKTFYTGKSENRSSLTWKEILNLKKKTHFGEVEIETLFEQFKTLAPVESGITREAFNQCLGPLGRQKNLVMDRMFLFYDQNGDGIISFEEFVCALSVLVKGSQDEKLKYVFEGYDLDKKGYLTDEDFHLMFKAYFTVSMELVRDYVKTCEEEMKAAFDETADKPVSSAFHAPIPHGVGGASAPDVKSLHQLPSHSGAVGHGGAQPLMEAMSQDAIDEMVVNVFKCADLDKDGKITFEEFKTWSVLDNTILAWFEALGTIF